MANSESLIFISLCWTGASWIVIFSLFYVLLKIGKIYFALWSFINVLPYETIIPPAFTGSYRPWNF